MAWPAAAEGPGLTRTRSAVPTFGLQAAAWMSALRQRATMLQLSRRRMSMSAASIVAALAFAAPAFALPPEVTLTSPSGYQSTNPPAFAGTAGTKEWESREIAVDVWAGEGVGDKPLQIGNALL